MPTALRLAAALLASASLVVAGGPVRVAKCGAGPAELQRWAFNSPEAGFVRNTATRQCWNVAGCHTDLIYDACEVGVQTCGGAGLKGQPNEQFTLKGTQLVSAIENKCVTLTTRRNNKHHTKVKICWTGTN